MRGDLCHASERSAEAAAWFGTLPGPCLSCFPASTWVVLDTFRATTDRSRLRAERLPSCSRKNALNEIKTGWAELSLFALAAALLTSAPSTTLAAPVTSEDRTSAVETTSESAALRSPRPPLLALGIGLLRAFLPRSISHDAIGTNIELSPVSADSLGVAAASRRLRARATHRVRVRWRRASSERIPTVRTPSGFSRSERRCAEDRSSAHRAPRGSLVFSGGGNA